MNTQPELFQSDQKASSQSDLPVVCLGFEFENDTVRQEYFTELLSEKLKDPEFRSIEGFPLGEDEDILNLSDPPYYTACPNPWISDFINEWESEKPEKPEGYEYHREPFAADVNEGKNDPIYNAHSYHTKVPHKAIMRYILHYTSPGDVIFDGFCGTGMAGIAAKMCGDKSVVESLGYRVDDDGIIFKEEVNSEGLAEWVEFSKMGSRKAVLNDLSPIASFIAYNYNTPVDKSSFELNAHRILREVQDEYGWMYETKHTDEETKGVINYTVWSDILICSNCGEEVNYWKAAIDKDQSEVKDIFKCPECSVEIEKKLSEKAYESYFDESIQEVVKIVKQVPVLINYSVGNKRYEKVPTDTDLDVIRKINDCKYKYEFPSVKIPNGAKTREPILFGATYTHLMYTKRNLIILSAVLNKIEKEEDSRLKKYLKIWFTSSQSRLHRMNRYAAKHQRHVGPLANTLYISSTPTEISPFYFLDLKIQKNILNLGQTYSSVVQIGSASEVLIKDDSLDYIFIDPPFGHNIMYSDLNIVLEAWLRVLTNSVPEAIENKHQKKGPNEYRYLMTDAFANAYRALKPGRWLTVEFSNTKASVWNAIQTSLSDAGFVIANVAALNKGRGGLHAIIGPTAVKQDLVISAYKPDSSFEATFNQHALDEDGVWEFINEHLGYLPVIKFQGSELITIPERDPRILYDQVVTYYVRKGYSVPIDSQDFQLGLAQRFSERDGMYFLEEQAAEYDRKKMLSGGRAVQQSLFISDEASAIEWLRNLLRDKPQGYQDINPKFMTEISGWGKNEVSLELSTLLEQNFLRYDGKGRVPEQIHSYLSTNWKDMRNLEKDDPQLIAKAKDRWYVPDPAKAGDLEKLRERALLREFDDYIESKKKLKLFRLEAVRAGFKKSWQERDYKTIIDVAEKLPTKVLEEDPKLLMWYDQAITRSEVL